MEQSKWAAFFIVGLGAEGSTFESELKEIYDQIKDYQNGIV